MRAPRQRLALGLSGLVMGALFLVPAPLHGESHATITGRVVNGTPGGVAPPNLEVTLYIIGSGGEADPITTMTDKDGRFRFRNVPESDVSTYSVTGRYQNVQYSTVLDPRALADPVELLVYETTGSTESVHVSADILQIGEPDQDERSLSAFQVIRLENEGDRTFVPDLSQPGNMNFLRFSLPAVATNLDVSSDLLSGPVIRVDTGFALAAPVTPGSHEVTYSYTLPYEGSQLALTRSFPMGADAFHVLLQGSLGELNSSGSLIPLPPFDIDGKSYTVWGATQLTPGSRLAMVIDHLPQLPLLDRVGKALSDGPYLRVGIPWAVAIGLAGLVAYALAFKQTGGASGGALSPSGASHEPGMPLKDERKSLVQTIAQLDNLLQRGEIAQADYKRRRQELKTRLLSLALAAGSDESEGVVQTGEI